MKKVFEVLKESFKVIGLIVLGAVTIAFGAWLTMILFNHAPVFKQIGEALGISGLKAKDWCLAYLAYFLISAVAKLYTYIIKAITG